MKTKHLIVVFLMLTTAIALCATASAGADYWKCIVCEDTEMGWINIPYGDASHKPICAACGAVYASVRCEGGTATCSKQAKCTSCGQRYGRLDPDNHTYKKVTVPATCTENGYSKYTCTGCGDSYGMTKTAALTHWFGPWSANGDGTHSATCLREDCGYTSVRDCTIFTANVGETALTACPICGNEGFSPIEGAEISAIGNTYLPIGEALIFGKAAPCEGVLYAFTATHEYSGRIEPYTVPVAVSLPCDMADFTLMHADAEGLTECAFTLEDGILSLETDHAALFLLLPNTPAEEAAE